MRSNDSINEPNSAQLYRLVSKTLITLFALGIVLAAIWSSDGSDPSDVFEIIVQILMIAIGTNCAKRVLQPNKSEGGE